MSSILRKVFRQGLQLFFFSFFQNNIKFFLSKLSKFDILRTIINLSVGLSVISTSFLKWYFHFWSLCSWLLVFNFSLDMIFLFLASFTVYHTYKDCFSDFIYLALDVCFLFFEICFNSISLDFLKFFCSLMFVGFLSLSKDTFFPSILLTPRKLYIFTLVLRGM